MTAVPAGELTPTGLPVEEVVGDVFRALADDGPRVAVLVAPPGAGKTTVVPLRLLTRPWIAAGERIVVLEPRRLAARAAAQRMALLLGEPVGRTVGYRTRDERRVTRATRIEVVTEGILVRRLQADPSLPGTSAVILDEVHERNLVTDLSLALTLDARAGLRPDLRVLAMSATLDDQRLATLMGADAGPAPVIRSDGRQHPVTLRYDPPAPNDRPDAHVARAVASVLAATSEGDVLAFLPGAAVIRRVAERLTPAGALPAGVDVRPLFGALPAADQDAALAPSPVGRRRVVLATDIAESSLTVAGVRIVVDAGLVRVPRHDPATGLSALRTETASRAAADQRAGRAGRLGPGLALRLWSEHDHARRAPFAVPEIAAVDLAGFALELATWGAQPGELALLDPPPASGWAEATALLERLGALDSSGRPTATGRAMADLPLHPRLGRLVVDGFATYGRTALVVAALLEERDIFRGRPGDVTADLAARVEVMGVDGRNRVAGAAEIDRNALRTVRRRVQELGRRSERSANPRSSRRDPDRRREARNDDQDHERLDLDAVGPLVALAYPDRLAQGRGGATFRLRDGGGGRLATSDPLATAAWLAVAGVDLSGRDARITSAAALDESDLVAMVGGQVTVDAELIWDEARNDLRARTTRRSGALVLGEADGPAAPGPTTDAALVARVIATDGAVLHWTTAARGLQDRLGFLHQLDRRRWPDRSDAALMGAVDEWLPAMLPGATGRRDLERLDLIAVLRAGLAHADLADLDRLAPTAFETPGGRTIPISYTDSEARASARVQDLFGTTVHPAVGGTAKVPVVVELLSPANRPIQVTADLPGFWTGSWQDVRKDLAGRYPKHAWPVDPSVADARLRPRRGGKVGR